MGKDLIIEALSISSQSGYRDKIAIIENNASNFHCQCSLYPDSFSTVNRRIACNTKETPYKWICIYRNEKVISISIRFAPAYYIHCGVSEDLRGVNAYITIPPIVWSAFIDKFTIGETGLLYISDFNKSNAV